MDAVDTGSIVLRRTETVEIDCLQSSKPEQKQIKNNKRKREKENI